MGRVALITFAISLLISLAFQSSLAIWVSSVLLVLVMVIGVAFDIVGSAVMAATEAPFHAMGADKVRGAKQAVYLLRHADQVANFCNDVIGGIAETMSGAIVAGIVIGFARDIKFASRHIVEAVAIALVASINVSGKSLGKTFAVNQANQIVFFVGKLLAFLRILNPAKKKRRNNNNPATRKVKR